MVKKKSRFACTSGPPTLRRSFLRHAGLAQALIKPLAEGQNKAGAKKWWPLIKEFGITAE
jgi:hypothetical protein